jgi:hypothetical protein
MRAHSAGSKSYRLEFPSLALVSHWLLEGNLRKFPSKKDRPGRGEREQASPWSHTRPSPRSPSCGHRVDNGPAVGKFLAKKLNDVVCADRCASGTHRKSLVSGRPLRQRNFYNLF